jgi:hypothetical protein
VKVRLAENDGGVDGVSIAPQGGPAR